MALVVGEGNVLITTIERSDLPRQAPMSTSLTVLGALQGRTVRPDCALTEATATLERTGRRRMAVVDDHGRLVGLLCLKGNGTGYCSDEGIAARRIDLGDIRSPEHTTLINCPTNYLDARTEMCEAGSIHGPQAEGQDYQHAGKG
jgi:hypothetical protein